MSRADRVRSAAIYWTADRRDRWRESGDELAELQRRAQRNGTTRREEAIRAWIAALTLVSDAHPNLRTREAFNAARREVRADLLGLTRRQSEQSDRRVPIDKVLADEPGLPDAALLEREQEREMNKLVGVVGGLALSATDRRNLLALARAKATGEPVPAAVRMWSKRWKNRNAPTLAALGKRFAAAYD
jgi:hypothetical protein